MAIFTGMKQSEKIVGLLMNCCWWGDYFTPKNPIVLVGRLGSPGFTPEKNDNIEIMVMKLKITGSVGGQRNGGGKRDKNRGVHVRGRG